MPITIVVPERDGGSVADIAAAVETCEAAAALVTPILDYTADIEALAPLTDELAALGPIAANIVTVASISANVTSVAGNATNINTVATNIANVNTVAGVSGHVTTVAGISANVTTVAGISGSVTTVAGVAASVATVATISADVSTVATIAANVTTVAAISNDVANLAGGLQAQIDALASGMTPKGAWAPSSGSFPSGATTGDFYIASGDGTVDGQAFIQGDWLIATTATPSTSVFAGNWGRGAYGPDTTARPLVIVASGQSNMDGAGYGGTMPPENAAVQMFDLGTREFRTLSYEDGFARVNVNNGTTYYCPTTGYNNLAFSFAHAAHEATGRPVYLILVANGGTHIGRWVGSGASDVAGYVGPWGAVGTASPLYVELADAVEDALALIDVDQIDAFLWHQGETARPGYTTVANYATDFATLRGKLQAESWWSDSTQFLAGELIIGSRYDDYQEFFRAFNSAGDPYLKCVSGLGLTSEIETNPTMKIHYNGEGLYQLGRRYWRAFLGDGAALAKRFDPDTTQYGAKAISIPYTARIGTAVTIDPLAGRILESKGIAAGRDGGGYLAGQKTTGAYNCTVTHNSDGTFTVTPGVIAMEDWSFTVQDYWIEGPAVTHNALVTGKVDQTVVEKFRLWLDGSTTAAMTIVLAPYLNAALSNALLQINWGDGTTETGLASASAHSHTYGSAYTGWVIVSAPAVCTVTQITLTTGKWSSPMSAFSALDGLISLTVSSSDNVMYGDLADLPATIQYITVAGNNTVTWDMSGLPALYQLAAAAGANTINAPQRKWAGTGRFFRLTLDGADRTSAQIDAIIIAMADVKAWDAGGYVYLDYAGQAARTSASDAAVATIVARGGAVYTN
jgi:hypothetical protein